MAEPTENGILEYLESVRAPENAKTFTEQQTGLGREGFRKYIPDPTQVADYLQDISNFVNTSAQQVADTDQEFMDEYYNEYPEKSADTAIGILSAFPAASGARLFGLMKSGKLAKASAEAYPNMLKDPAMKPFLQLLGLGTAKTDTGLKIREREEAEGMANGGELSNLNEIYNLLDSEYVTREGLNPNIDDKAAGLAKFFLPLNEDNSLNYGEAALAMTPFGFLTKAQKLAKLKKAGGKGKQTEMPLSTSSDPSIGPGRRDLLFTRERMTDNALSDKAGTGVLMGRKEALKLSNAAKVLNPKKILVDQSSTLTKPKGLLSTKQAEVLDDFPQLNKIDARVMRSPSRADYDKYIDQISADDLENSPLSLYELIELIKKSQ
tara:strand:+ start:25 stop:1161 length:1137 start_codon:yes stop_codon:yes gene_type:complete